MELKQFRDELEQELHQGILPFWSETMYDPNTNGFYGEADVNGTVDPEADRGIIMYTRILWTFSAAYRIYGNESYREKATIAFNYIVKYFIDREFGGVYWQLNSKGEVNIDKKQTYAQAFAIYGFSEYYRATKNEDALKYAEDLFFLIEKYIYDPTHKGYFEAFTRNWDSMEDIRLSSIDYNEPKSNNTHLHILEAYTTLYRANGDANVKLCIQDLLDIYAVKIIQPDSGHCTAFFSTEWDVKSDFCSYGHDIEGSWLLWDGIEAIGDSKRAESMRGAILRLTDISLDEGLDKDGSLLYEHHGDGRVNTDKHWWPQVEGIVGCLNAYQMTDDKKYLPAASGLWAFTRDNIVDPVGPEWFWKTDRAGTPCREDVKADMWKCPYHSARACMEGSMRLSTFL